MMLRRDFLRRLTVAGAGLLVGDAALEAFERLTHRPIFALGGLPEPSLHAKIWRIRRDVLLATGRAPDTLILSGAVYRALMADPSLARAVAPFGQIDRMYGMDVIESPIAPPDAIWPGFTDHPTGYATRSVSHPCDRWT